MCSRWRLRIHWLLLFHRWKIFPGLDFAKKTLQAIIDILSATNPEHDYKQCLLSYFIDDSIVRKSTAE